MDTAKLHLTFTDRIPAQFSYALLWPKTTPSFFYSLIISIPVLAQRPPPAAVSLPPADTVYFDRDWERTKTLEECICARIAHCDASGQPVGMVRDYYYPSWKKQSEGKMTHESPDRANGLCSGWDENRQLSFRGTFENGQAQADYRSWREDG